MRFELLPTIDKMIELYSLPRTPERFQKYLQILQGNQDGNLEFPIQGFNPMAKGHVLERLQELKAIDAEAIMADTINSLNRYLDKKHLDKTFKVALNLADDLHGGWTNRFTTDYDSKFKISGLLSRGFCTPIFWSSETPNEMETVLKTSAYIYRTIYRLDHPTPETLKEHVAQESFVAQETVKQYGCDNDDMKQLEHFFVEHADSTDFHLIFNFFYGDAASKSLEFPTFGLTTKCTGFDFASQRD